MKTVDRVQLHKYQANMSLLALLRAALEFDWQVFFDLAKKRQPALLLEQRERRVSIQEDSIA